MSKDGINTEQTSFFILKGILNKHSKFIQVSLHAVAIKQHIVQVEFFYGSLFSSQLANNFAKLLISILRKAMKLRCMATTMVKSIPISFFYHYQWVHWNLNRDVWDFSLDIPFRKPRASIWSLPFAYL